MSIILEAYFKRPCFYLRTLISPLNISGHPFSVKSLPENKTGIDPYITKPGTSAHQLYLLVSKLEIRTRRDGVV